MIVWQYDSMTVLWYSIISYDISKPGSEKGGILWHIYHNIIVTSPLSSPWSSLDDPIVRATHMLLLTHTVEVRRGRAEFCSEAPWLRRCIPFLLSKHKNWYLHKIKRYLLIPDDDQNPWPRCKTQHNYGEIVACYVRWRRWRPFFFSGVYWPLQELYTLPENWLGLNWNIAARLTPTTKHSLEVENIYLEGASSFEK